MGVSSSESHDLTEFYEMLSASFGVISQNTGFYPSLDRIIETTLGPLNLGPRGGSYNEPISRLHCHAAWIKNRIFTHSLNTDITPYQAYFGKKPSLATLQLFGCKAYAHTPKVDQTKFGECTIECIHIGFAEEKKANLL